ncbi:MAG TPA: hypothetical protein VFR24_13730 [Candidatus Angelobacter sp.]|nr:hypothetical protein [Candidatus Angelobacter sp.]
MCAEFNVDGIEEEFLKFAWLNLRPEDRVRILEKSPKTFWLFGAGASHHYSFNAFDVPVPLASGFFKAFHRLPTSQGFQAHVGPLISFLEHYRGVPPDRVGEWDENIEYFMTSVEKKLEEIREKKKERELTPEEFGDAFSYGTVFSNMAFIFANVLNEAQNGPSMSLYRNLLELSGPHDLFVTFNWDTLLDRALIDTGGWDPNVGYGLRFRAVMDGSWKDTLEGKPKFTTNWKLLKLHGSTNWLVPYMNVDFDSWEYKSLVPDADEVFLYWHSSLPYATHKNRWTGGYVPTTYCYYPPNIPAHFFTEKQLSPKPGYVFVKSTPKFLAAFKEEDPEGIPSSPILITPVRQKKYDTYRLSIQSLWTQAVKGLEDCHRLVIVGYSFPPTDTRALDLFRAFLAAKGQEIDVEIVSPDVKEIAHRIGEDHLDKAKTVQLHDMKLEEYTELLSEMLPGLMRQAADANPEILDWLKRIYFSSKRPQSEFKSEWSISR